MANKGASRVGAGSTHSRDAIPRAHTPWAPGGLLFMSEMATSSRGAWRLPGNLGCVAVDIPKRHMVMVQPEI